MPVFPSLEWCRAVESAVLKDPALPAAARDWGGVTVGVIIGKGDGLSKDWCLFVKPHPTELRLEQLRICEDEDDLELEEPDYLFRVPFGICKQVLRKQLDPLDVLRKGQIRVEGDMKKLMSYQAKYRPIGETAMEKIETVF